MIKKSLILRVENVWLINLFDKLLTFFLLKLRVNLYRLVKIWTWPQLYLNSNKITWCVILPNAFSKTKYAYQNPTLLGQSGINQIKSNRIHNSNSSFSIESKIINSRLNNKITVEIIIINGYSGVVGHIRSWSRRSSLRRRLVVLGRCRRL